MIVTTVEQNEALELGAYDASFKEGCRAARTVGWADYTSRRAARPNLRTSFMDSAHDLFHADAVSRGRLSRTGPAAVGS
jgi:hypothetical protein